MAGSEVTEEQLRALFEDARNPFTGERLGRPPAKYPTRQERIDRRVGKLPDTLTAEARAALVEKITAEEKETKTRTAVAGFDLTFSVPKSVSALWALAPTPRAGAAVPGAPGRVGRDPRADRGRGGVHPDRAPTGSAGSAPAVWSRPRSTTGTPARATRSCTPTSPSPTASRARTASGAPWTRPRCTRPRSPTPRPTTCCSPTRSPAAPA